MAGIIGKKLGMTQVYDDNGRLTPVTVIEAGPCPVLDVKTQEKDSYSALQIGFGSKRAKNVTKPVLGHLAKSGNNENPPALIKEIRLAADSEAEVGSPFVLYEETGSPFLLSRTERVKDASSLSDFSLLLPSFSGEFSKTNVTDMCFAGFPDFPPLNINSVTFDARNDLVDFGPRTN